MNGNGLASLITGFQQGYNWMDDVQRKQKDDAFTEKARGRKEKEWQDEDKYKADIDAVNKQFGFGQPDPEAAPAPIAAAGVAPSTPDAAAQPTASTTEQQPAPSASPAAPAADGTPIATAGAAPMAVPGAQIASKGLPQAPKPDVMRSMNNTLDYAMARAAVDVQHGKMDGAGLAGLYKVVDAFKSNKMNEAISLMNQGRYDEADQIYNSNGDHTGVKIISAQDGQFTIGKTAVPTKLVTIQNPDGSTRVINTAQALLQMQGIDKMLESAQRERELGMREDEAKNLQQYRNRSLGLQEREYADKTPQGIIAGKEKILGRKLTDDERREIVGISKLPEVVKTQVASLQKEGEALNQVIAKAMADGSWQADSENAKALIAQQRVIQLRVRNLTDPYMDDTKSSRNADPLGIEKSDPQVPEKPSPAALARTKGTQVAAPVPAQKQNGVADVSGDMVLNTLTQAMATLDPNDPANTQKIMAIGKAKNDRIAQLQEKFGSGTKLTGI